MTIYRGSDVSVWIDSSYAKRVQSFEATRSAPQGTVIELGHLGAKGVITGRTSYSARLVANEVGQDLIGDLGLTSSLQAYIQSNPSGNSVNCIQGGLTSAVINSIVYRADVSGPATIEIGLIGSGWATYNTTTPADSGVAAYTRESCSVNVGDNVQRASISANIPVTVVYDLLSATVVGYMFGDPEVSAEIECVHDGTTAWLPLTSQDIAITIGSVTITAQDCVSTREPHRGAIRSWATNIYNFKSTASNFTLS